MTVPAVDTRDFFGRGLRASALAHAAAFGTLYWSLFVRIPAAREVELDLSQLPRAVTPAPRRAAPRPAAKAWTAPVAGLAPAPAGATEAAETEDPLAGCPPPCPDRPGDFTPATLAASKPRWVAGFITDDDYPKVARQQGQDGAVMLSVFVDATGAVRDVRLLRGSYDALNKAALEKLKVARFEPARDERGRPIPVKLLLPIRFELK